MKAKESAQRIISSDNLDIYYWISRQQSSKGFFMLHPGSSMNHTSLAKLEDSLNKEGYSTIIHDPRGVGYSKAPAEKQYYDIEKFSSDVEKILTREGIEAPRLLGHSAGFMVFADYVANTKNAKQLIGVCGSYYFPDTTANKALFHFFNHIFRYTEYIGSIGTAFAHATTNTKRLYNDQSDSRSGLATWLSITGVPLSEVNAHIVSGKVINTWNVESQLRYIKTPTLLVYANKDLAVAPQTGKYIKQIMPGECTLETIQGVSHDLPIRHPEKLMEILGKNMNPLNRSRRPTDEDQ
jgi:pimeloyl-ACP methyl ester carboxylesterase